VESNQPRLASDVIFVDARDALDSLREHVEQVRDTAVTTAQASHVALRRQHMIFSAIAVLIWVLIALLFMPTGSEASDTTAPTIVERSSSTNNTTTTTTAVAPSDRMLFVPESPAPVPTKEPARLAAAPSVSRPDLTAAAALCSDLARASSLQELQSLLGRAAHMLQATGVVVWLADLETLYPVASWGYDDRMMARVTSIPCDAANLTAAAFRNEETRTSAAIGTHAAAVAVPLIGPNGPVGVFSGELPRVSKVDENITAIAAIVAAQLVTLIAPEAEHHSSLSSMPDPLAVSVNTGDLTKIT
jgi:hypothetical protein